MNTGLTRLRLRAGGRVSLGYVNRTPHLDGARPAAGSADAARLSRARDLRGAAAIGRACDPSSPPPPSSRRSRWRPPRPARSRTPKGAEAAALKRVARSYVVSHGHYTASQRLSTALRVSTVDPRIGGA